MITRSALSIQSKMEETDRDDFADISDKFEDVRKQAQLDMQLLIGRIKDEEKKWKQSQPAQQQQQLSVNTDPSAAWSMDDLLFGHKDTTTPGAATFNVGMMHGSAKLKRSVYEEDLEVLADLARALPNYISLGIQSKSAKATKKRKNSRPYIKAVFCIPHYARIVMKLTLEHSGIVLWMQLAGIANVTFAAAAHSATTTVPMVSETHDENAQLVKFLTMFVELWDLGIKQSKANAIKFNGFAKQPVLDNLQAPFDVGYAISLQKLENLPELQPTKDERKLEIDDILRTDHWYDEKPDFTENEQPAIIELTYLLRRLQPPPSLLQNQQLSVVQGTQGPAKPGKIKKVVARVHKTGRGVIIGSKTFAQLRQAMDIVLQLATKCHSNDALDKSKRINSKQKKRKTSTLSLLDDDDGLTRPSKKKKAKIGVHRAFQAACEDAMSTTS